VRVKVDGWLASQTRDAIDPLANDALAKLPGIANSALPPVWFEGLKRDQARGSGFRVHQRRQRRQRRRRTGTQRRLRRRHLWALAGVEVVAITRLDTPTTLSTCVVTPPKA